MRANFFIIIQVFLFASFLTACKVKHVEQSNKEYLIHQQLSREIESTKTEAGQNFIIEKKGRYSSQELPISKEINSESHKVIINSVLDKREISIEKDQKKINKQHYGIEKNLSPQSAMVDRDNIFWKIGKVLFQIGIVILSIGGGVFISSSGSGIFFIGLIGLAIIVLSLPFFLLAVITTYMKKKSTPIERRGYEEEI